MSKKKVIKAVKKRLEDVGHDIEFDIVEKGVRAEDKWWYVPVLAHKGKKGITREVTVGIFANVENALYKSDKLTVLLIPVVD
jgi:hypothetical protein